MLYAVLCYNDEDTVFSWTQAEDDAVMERLAVVHGKVPAARFGPSARLQPTSTATTLHKSSDPPMIIDGPYAETKEQLLGFYVVDFDTFDEALEWLKELGKANPGGAYEIRPVRLFAPGGRKA
jgi:hypothetical protein